MKRKYFQDDEVQEYKYNKTVKKMLPKRLLFKILDYKVYLVNGIYVRNNIHVDFWAGHHLADDYIPKIIDILLKNKNNEI